MINLYLIGMSFILESLLQGRWVQWKYQKQYWLIDYRYLPLANLAYHIIHGAMNKRTACKKELLIEDSEFTPSQYASPKYDLTNLYCIVKIKIDYLSV